MFPTVITLLLLRLFIIIDIVGVAYLDLRCLTVITGDPLTW